MRTLVLACSLLFAAASASADTFTVTGQLTGDFRAGNPDNLVVDVTVNVVDDVASWVVDLDSPLHPDVKLHIFAFNLDLGALTPTFSNFTPDNAGMNKDWASVSGTNVPGSGSADFDFAVQLGGAGNPNDNQVNNATDLTFDMTFGSGDFWTEAMFTGAGLSTGGGIPAPGSQMGAHLQSLVQGPTNTTDSGFASGDFTDDPGGPGAPGDPIPEPGTLALGALGVAALFIARRRSATRA